MNRARVARLGVLCAWLATTGCMTLREIPRKEFAVQAERKGVRVETRDGLVYEFDWASFAGDTLVGYRNRPDVEGPVGQVTIVRVPFEDVQRLTARQLDWRRTGMVGGGVVASALALGLRSAAQHDSPPSGGNYGGSTRLP
jgi:hypothetical protein